jgi:hypothetical protein
MYAIATFYQLVAKLWLVFLGVTLGADDFSTRAMWSDYLSSQPILRFACIQGMWHGDIEVVRRCRDMTSYTIEKHINDKELAPKCAIVALVLLGGPDKEVGAYLGDMGYKKHNELLEIAAREVGLLERGRFIPYGVTGTTAAVTEMRQKIRVQMRKMKP